MFPESFKFIGNSHLDKEHGESSSKLWSILQKLFFFLYIWHFQLATENLRQIENPLFWSLAKQLGWVWNVRHSAAVHGIAVNSRLHLKV